MSWRTTWDQDDRRTIAIGFIEAIDEVEAAGAAGTGTGHELPGELPFRARREGARLLMAHMDPLDLALMDGVGDAVKRVTDDPVAPLYAGCLQRVDQHIRDSLAHPEPPVLPVNVAAIILA
jgi:hypothetical protein